ncbi:hypothetical protein ACFV9P_03845 [Streptomyces sp. NPDC059892]|uniref:hypothetical protein n=1 Tax=Streptomyces sp. NPDC059892 TaxID=3346989 RepID=UPI00365CBDCA
MRKDQPGDTEPEPEEARPPNGTSSQQAQETGNAYAGPNAIAISGNVHLVRDTHYIEGAGEELVLTLLNALDSLRSDTRGLDGRRGPEEQDVTAEARPLPVDQARKAVPPPPTGVPPPHRSRKPTRVSRVKRLAAIPLAVLLASAIVVVVADVVGTRLAPGPDGKGATRQPAGRVGGPGVSPSHSASAAPTKTPPRKPPATPDDPGGTTATPSPRPSPSPSTLSKTPAPAPPPPPGPQRPPRETASRPPTPDPVSGKVFIVRGHGNEMNVNLTGFAPDEDVTIYAYTDTDATDGPYDQRTHTIDADGTREFGAFPMEAHGRYWVVARGVTSNVIAWTGR